MKSVKTDILVVGGGPVGSAVALELHRAGREVLLIDAGASPGKVCGEGLLPPGWDALQALGVADLVEEKAPMSEIVYQMPSPRDGDLRPLRAVLSRPSYGVRREVLCRAFSQAMDQHGVEVWRPARFRKVETGGPYLKVEVETGEVVTVHCRTLIGADGLHSPVRRHAGLQSSQPRTFSRWGTRIYLRATPRPGVVVTLGDGVESYMTPLGADLFGLSCIWSPHLLGRDLPGDGPVWRRLMSRFPESFRQTLPDDSAFFGSERAIGPLHQLVTSPLHPEGRIALVGDAAGYLDALTGEGLCLGLLQARALCQCVLGGDLSAYPRLHRDIKRRHQIVVTLLLKLLSHAALKERVYASLVGAPGFFRALIGLAAEHKSPSSLLVPDLPRFLALMLFARP